HADRRGTRPSPGTARRAGRGRGGAVGAGGTGTARRRRPHRDRPLAGTEGSTSMTTTALTPRQQRLKEEFTRTRGTWSDAWEAILRLDPDFLESYLRLSTVPWRKNHLENKVKEFIYIAANAAATHLYTPGIRQHIRAALAFGATER